MAFACLDSADLQEILQGPRPQAGAGSPRSLMGLGLSMGFPDSAVLGKFGALGPDAVGAQASANAGF